ncbi:hypothetical protein ACJW30_04G027900 [Castanea mollissima]
MVERPEIEPSKQCRIYKVPNPLRKWNEEAYSTPQVVSIGPFHHKNKRLKAMEEHKERYFRSVIRDMEESIRGCYEETIDLTSDRFVKMILLDAIFILELFIRRTRTSRSQISDDPNVVDPRSNILRVDHLLLLENQLPFFATPNVKMEHFTDLTRTFLLPPLEKLPKRNSKALTHLYSATKLHEAGVKFEAVRRVLKIPNFDIETKTEVIARNIMALEQTRYIKDAYYTDYFDLLDFLINTTKDVDLLCDKKILVNYLGDNNTATLMINNLNISVIGDWLNGFYENLWHKKKATLKSDYFNSPWKTVSTVAAIILLVLTFIQTIFSIISRIKSK